MLISFVNAIGCSVFAGLAVGQFNTLAGVYTGLAVFSGTALLKSLADDARGA